MQYSMHFAKTPEKTATQSNCNRYAADFNRLESAVLQFHFLDGAPSSAKIRHIAPLAFGGKAWYNADSIRNPVPVAYRSG